MSIDHTLISSLPSPTTAASRPYAGHAWSYCEQRLVQKKLWEIPQHDRKDKVQPKVN